MHAFLQRPAFLFYMTSILNCMDSSTTLDSIVLFLFAFYSTFLSSALSYDILNFHRQLHSFFNLQWVGMNLQHSTVNYWNLFSSKRFTYISQPNLSILATILAEKAPEYQLTELATVILSAKT